MAAALVGRTTPDSARTSASGLTADRESAGRPRSASRPSGVQDLARLLLVLGLAQHALGRQVTELPEQGQPVVQAAPGRSLLALLLQRFVPVLVRLGPAGPPP